MEEEERKKERTGPRLLQRSSQYSKTKNKEEITGSSKLV